MTSRVIFECDGCGKTVEVPGSNVIRNGLPQDWQARGFFETCPDCRVLCLHCCRPLPLGSRVVFVKSSLPERAVCARCAEELLNADVISLRGAGELDDPA